MNPSCHLLFSDRAGVLDGTAEEAVARTCQATEGSYRLWLGKHTLGLVAMRGVLVLCGHLKKKPGGHYRLGFKTARRGQTLSLHINVHFSLK